MPQSRSQCLHSCRLSNAMLSKEEEKQLAEDLFEKGDLESAQKLVLAHLR